MTVTRPALRYYGGKWRIAPWIIENMPPHRIYVEPFGGAASVLLRKPRCYAEVYNDLDGEIVNLFQVLRSLRQSKRLIELLELTPFSRDEFVLSSIPTDNPVEQARRTVVRSFMGFGTSVTSRHRTGFRGNCQRQGSIPAHGWRSYPLSLALTVERLRGVVIENRPALDVIRQYDSPQTLFYLDPPYPHRVRSHKWAKYAYRHDLTDDDHRKLASVLHQAAGMVMISCYPCNLYLDLYADWEHTERRAMADAANERIEILWMSPNCYAARLPLFSLKEEGK